MNISFTKMHGCGNDFIVLDHRVPFFSESRIPGIVRKFCMRKTGIGANGVMLAEKSDVADIKMRYFNADGSEGEMCGNGARCFARFVFDNLFTLKEMSLETTDGIYSAAILDHHLVRIGFPRIEKSSIRLDEHVSIGNQQIVFHEAWVGVPHIVVNHEAGMTWSNEKFADWAQQLKATQRFLKNGTNVNLIARSSQQELHIRTFERGVEEETLACGSGATAAAILSALAGKVTAPVTIQTRGGPLIVDFAETKNGIESITLTGEAITVFQGKIQMDRGDLL